LSQSFFDAYTVNSGLAQPNIHTLDLTLDSPEIKQMRSRCNNFVPGLENADYDPDASLVQGLRPLRSKNVRVERELRRKKDGSFSRIVHSYGHGGSGFSLSFGCASDVLGLLMQLEACIPPSPMSIGPQETLAMSVASKLMMSKSHEPIASVAYAPRIELHSIFSGLRALVNIGKYYLRLK
jgi:glycine/D-amino acid oxidase-like deaminating enzyme